MFSEAELSIFRPRSESKAGWRSTAAVWRISKWLAEVDVWSAEAGRDERTRRAAKSSNSQRSCLQHHLISSSPSHDTFDQYDRDESALYRQRKGRPDESPRRPLRHVGVISRVSQALNKAGHRRVTASMTQMSMARVIERNALVRCRPPRLPSSEWQNCRIRPVGKHTSFPR